MLPPLIILSNTELKDHLFYHAQIQFQQESLHQSG